MTVYIIHENDAWIPPFRTAFEKLGLTFVEWNLNDVHHYSLSNLPDRDAIYFNRISPSSHTRNHRYSCEITAQLLDYLSLHSCRIINEQNALTLELSKVKQYVELTRNEIRVPRTAFVASAASLTDENVKEKFIEEFRRTAKENFYESKTNRWTPFVSKHNRAGKGLGVHLFTNERDIDENFSNLIRSSSSNEDFSVDGIYLLQEYIKSPRQVINRAEFIGFQLIYVVEVDTRQGFQLCPSDACRRDAKTKLVQQSADEIRHGFEIRPNSTLNEREKRVVEQLENFLRQRQIEVAGIEWVDDGETIYVYDVNCNTNYNVAAEIRAFGEIYGTIKLGEYFQSQLQKMKEKEKDSN